MTDTRTLAAGVGVAASAMLLTHPLAIATSLALAIWFAQRSGALRDSPGLLRLALGIGASVAVLNGLFSWNGDTELLRAPFRIALLGRPIITLEGIAWGVAAGAQLAATTLALGAATLSVEPETLHRAMLRTGMPTSLATAAGLGWRMVPDGRRDAQAMRAALRTRGIETAGARGAAHVLVPLTARALDRAHLAEEALLMRGYDRAAMRRRRSGHWTLAGTATLAAIGVAALVAFAGTGRPPYYPLVDASLSIVTLGQLSAAAAIPALLVSGVGRRSN